MTYLPEESRIIYRSKDNRQEKTFDALDWLAAMCSHIPDQREQMVRYYGFYSNVSRGLRQKENMDDLIPCVLKAEEKAEPNRHWARLIRKIYEVDPLTCPKCRGLMRVISIIEDQEVIDKILSHLGLCRTSQRLPPIPKSLEIQIDYSDTQLTFYEEAFNQDFGTSTDHSPV
jgi:hypothetical protein